MSENKIHNMWPVQIGEFYNPEHDAIKNELLNFFKEYENKYPEGNPHRKAKGEYENYNLYESSYSVHQEKNSAFNKLLKFISQGFMAMSNNSNKKLIDNMEQKPKFNVEITESWFIRYNKGGVVFPHNHGGSYSCVYYVQIGKDSKKINGSTYFLKPYIAGSNIDFGSQTYSTDLTAIIEGQEGKLVVWPSYLYHGSHPYSGEENRIIVSANSKIDLITN